MKITVKLAESGKFVGEVTWTSSDKKVATVDKSGNVTGIKQGSCVISVKTNNSNTVKCKTKLQLRLGHSYILQKQVSIKIFSGV
nr:Ig-like domain-containing protein [uncultured Anaerocolumna sp.]